MINTYLSKRAFICVFFLLIPAISYACESAKLSVSEQEESELANLDREGGHANLYNFRSGRCAPLDKAKTELEVSAFLPSDETSQGMYQMYRDQGESQAEALKHALKFMLDEQHS